MPNLSPLHAIASRSPLTVLAPLFAALAISGCGGGSNSSNTSSGTTSASLPRSASLAQQCASPRPDTRDTQGSLDTEKAFVHSWIDETYLWYQDARGLPVSTLEAANYSTPVDFFASLKTPLITGSGKPKDQFHFTYDTPTWTVLSQSGVSYGYGFQIELLSAAPPRSAVVAFTDPNTPASARNIARGATVLTVDGVDLANGSDVSALNAGLFPTQAGDHTLVIQDQGATTPRTVTLTAASIVRTPVQNAHVLPAPNAGTGYLLFNDHIATAEAELVDAITVLKAANVTDLVLDLRYNGGGYLDIASELAYMIAGPTNTTGKFFERETFNDKNPFNTTTADDTVDFHTTAQGFSLAQGTALPTLGLNRVFVLTSASTCSASEAIVNGLRGAEVTVNLIGKTTCGKPYGFYPKENCNTTYFAIQFQGVNNVGFGNYADGFAPTCTSTDDFTHALGDPAESQLRVALGLRNTGACVAPAGLAKQGIQSTGAFGRTPASPVLPRDAFRENRILRSKGQV
ncbi:MAG: S41 family peptidase [Betaproteobacteria bacterium]